VTARVILDHAREDVFSLPEEVDVGDSEAFVVARGDVRVDMAHGPGPW